MSESASVPRVLRTSEELRADVRGARRAGHVIACVPTMGALHRGHTSLIEAAAAAGTHVVVTIFVNPTQFGPAEDFANYPRDEAGDLRVCAAAGAHAVFLPSAAAMYPPGAATRVRVGGLTDGLCAVHRPGHFDGVATVVTKLLNLVQPDRAYFGLKDYQQYLVIRRLVRDLDLPVQVIGCPTVREADGLALSSRNAYLSPTERLQAGVLYRALCAARDSVREGITDAAALRRELEALILSAGPAVIDYVELVDPETLRPLDPLRPPLLAALAVRIGRTRLIDNLLIEA